MLGSCSDHGQIVCLLAEDVEGLFDQILTMIFGGNVAELWVAFSNLCFLLLTFFRDRHSVLCACLVVFFVCGCATVICVSLFVFIHVWISWQVPNFGIVFCLVFF